jgi:predicted TIM-barrel fold metal-dependent hydrolase
MITEYSIEHRRYDQPEYEPFWAAASALDLPLSLHTATLRQGKIRGAGPGTLICAAGYPHQRCVSGTHTDADGRTGATQSRRGNRGADK